MTPLPFPDEAPGAGHPARRWAQRLHLVDGLGVLELGRRGEPATKLHFFDAELLPQVEALTWCELPSGYARSWNTYLHQTVTGVRPGPGFQVDHIDRDRRNNQRVNLRTVTCRQNHANMPNQSTAGVGVTHHKDRSGFRVSVRASISGGWVYKPTVSYGPQSGRTRDKAHAVASAIAATYQAVMAAVDRGERLHPTRDELTAIADAAKLTPARAAGRLICS